MESPLIESIRYSHHGVYRSPQIKPMLIWTTLEVYVDIFPKVSKRIFCFVCGFNPSGIAWVYGRSCELRRRARASGINSINGDKKVIKPITSLKS